MLTLIGLILCVFAAGILAPVAVLAIQLLMAMPAGRTREMPTGRRPTVAVLVPAHNEMLLIAETVRSLVPLLVQGDRLLVVADNCTDDTARIAVTAGAEVIERNDPSQRGKPYALDFGVRHLERDPPEIVLIVDADCRLESDALERLIRLGFETGRPVQGLYLMRSPPGAGLRTRIAEFAWLVKNQIRAIGMQRLGLSCQLMGSGMAFPWRCISTVAFSGDFIAEDYKLGLDLARAGTPALFCPEARVLSHFPSTADGIASQRTRWEHGHLALIAGKAPRLLIDAAARRNLQLMSLVVDLSVPPLALLSLLVLTGFFAGAVFYVATDVVTPLAISIATVILYSAAVLLAWACYARHVVSMCDLVYAPIYALRKIPLYARFLVNRQVEWVRSRRDGE